MLIKFQIQIRTVEDMSDYDEFDYDYEVDYALERLPFYENLMEASALLFLMQLVQVTSCHLLVR